MFEKQLKINILNCSEDLQDFLNSQFLYLGQEIHNYSSINALSKFKIMIRFYKKIKLKNAIFFIIIYLDSIEEINWMFFLIELYKKKSQFIYKFIILTKKINGVFIQSMLFLGVEKIILIDELDYTKIMKSIFLSIQETYPLKKQNPISVKIENENEKTYCYLKIPNTNRIIITIICTLSMEQTALEVQKFQDLKSLLPYKDKDIPNAEFIIDSQIIICSLKLKKIIDSNPIILCEFYNINPRFLNFLTNFLMQKLSVFYSTNYKKELEEDS